jgi:uncharacterized protein YkwD
VNKVWIGIATISISLLPTPCQRSRAENLTIIDRNNHSILILRDYANELPQHLAPMRSDRSRLPLPNAPTTHTISIALNTQTSISLSRVEQSIISEMNRARSNPPAYRKVLLSWRNRFSGKKAKLSNRLYLITQEGTPAIDEAIQFLQKTRPVSTLKFSRGLTLAARDLVRDQGVRGITGHQGSDGSTPFQRMERYGKWQKIAGENIAYGPDTAQSVVRDLIIDDGVRDRGHRTNMFQPQFRLTGVACGYHRQYRVMCDIKYAGGYVDR